MGWRSKGLAAAVLALVAVLVAGPSAQAADPLPPPVDPLRTLPSTYAKSVFTGAPLIDDQIKFAAWALQQSQAAKTATATGSAVAQAVPITGSRAITAGAAGGALTAGFMAGWMITDGALAMYSHATGQNPLAPSCQWGDFGQAVVSVLYPFSSPDCFVPVLTPNADMPIEYGSVTYGGYTALFKGTFDLGPTGGGPWACYSVSGTLSSPFTARTPSAAGPIYGAGPNFVNWASQCTSLGGTKHVVGLAYPGDTTRSTSPAVKVINQQTEEVLATMSETRPNPGRVPKCDLTWPDGSHTVKTGAPYSETTGLPLGSFSALCNESYVSKPGHGPDLLPSRISIGSTPETGGAYTELADSPVPEFSPSEKKGLTPGTSGGLVLQKVVGTVVDSCMTWAADCSDWWTATSAGTVEATDTGTYRCLWNGEAVALTECGVYRNTFDTRTSTPTITDPTTGTQHPWSSGSPAGSVSVDPAADCFASGWASVANPIEWVLVPVKCALVWAFVPRATAVDATVTALGTAAGDVSTVEPLMAMLDSLPAAGGCSGIPIELTFFGQTASGNLLNACSGFGQTAATVVNGLLTLAVATGALVAVTRYAAAVFGFVGPGGNIEQTQYQAMQRAARSD